MKSAVLLTAALSAVAQAQLSSAPGCPSLNGLSLGNQIPLNPDAIGQGCNDFEVLVARGTSEPNAPGGNFGIVVGDPVINNITAIFPRVRGYPVQYPASNATGSVAIGVQDIINRLNNQSTLCPRQKFGLVGYSQGSAVIHQAAQNLSESIQAKVLAYIPFGDPYRRVNLQDDIPNIINRRALEVCAGVGTNDTDPVCDPKGKCFATHLTYIQPKYINQAVDFLVERFSSSL